MQVFRVLPPCTACSRSGLGPCGGPVLLRIGYGAETSLHKVITPNVQAITGRRTAASTRLRGPAHSRPEAGFPFLICNGIEE